MRPRYKIGPIDLDKLFITHPFADDVICFTQVTVCLALLIGAVSAIIIAIC